MKCFLVADYAVNKAIFIKDVEAYRLMRFDSARKRIARLIYDRFVSTDGQDKFSQAEQQMSVFKIIQKRRKHKDGDHNWEEKRPESKSRRARPKHSPVSRKSSEHGDANDQGPSEHVSRVESMLQMGDNNNPIGVYGKAPQRIGEKVGKGESPPDLFDEVARDVMTDLKLDVFPRFKQSDFYRKYVRTKYIERVKVNVKTDFVTFRVLGRGGFGAVHACRKRNSGTIYAMKCINKKLVKVKTALENVMEERNVLTMMDSPFVTNLKYALMDEENLYLIMDLMLGGDLKFHLIHSVRFPEKRAKFYAAQVLLALEHVHSKNVIYRDMKLENVLLDHNGNCRISDLGLAVVTKKPVKGYAGTPGYTAPEMVSGHFYGPSADIFSYGVMLYRMLYGQKPFKGKIDKELDKAVVERQATYPPEVFSDDARDLLQGLLQKKPDKRLGSGFRGIQEIKDHPFFESIDWGLLEAGYLDPPFVPSKFDVNAASLKDIGDFDKGKYRHVKIDERFKDTVNNFEHINVKALQEEMVAVLEKADENVNFEKFAESYPGRNNVDGAGGNGPFTCCTIM
jgi:serine/threonine protein kinase